MNKTRNLDFPGPAGRLEGLLMTPSDAPRAAAVLCHAHPLHGGMMHFKLLYRVAKVLQRAGLAVLRFNFRGVGRSGGEHDHGRGEQEDVRSAIDALATEVPDVPVVVGGFSFGAVMALRAGDADPRAAALLALGYPVGAVPRLERGPRNKPTLFVQGERDEFGSPEAIGRLVGEDFPNGRLVIVPGADHFFTGHLRELERAVSDWLVGEPWKPL